jgi:GST-like protein
MALSAPNGSLYVPPRVWQLNKPTGGAFANINRPTAGARHEEGLPVGWHPLQLYSLATPNGVKVTILFEFPIHCAGRGTLLTM